MAGHACVPHPRGTLLAQPSKRRQRFNANTSSRHDHARPSHYWLFSAALLSPGTSAFALEPGEVLVVANTAVSLRDRACVLLHEAAGDT